MRRPDRPLVALALVVATLSGAACTVGKKLGLSSATELSYAQVQSIQPGLTAAQIRDAFGPPMSASVGPDGRTSRMEYVAMDAKQSRARLILDFDARGALVNRTYTGAILRP
jgi:outer membrane protein assembly factor BamE (lipoprotein component of BamABCDE complex)